MARVNLCITLNEMGEFKESVECCDNLQNQKWLNSNPEALIAYGTALRNCERYQEAQQKYDLALSINPRHS